METIKLGSTGEAVKTLQEKLGVTVDGDFGPKTEKAVKEYQSKNNLTADGIVGPKTWESLGIKTNSSSSVNTNKCVDDSVIYLPLSKHVTKLANRAIKYLAIHYTAGGSSKEGSAQHIKSVFEKREASADFAVDDRDMVQFNPDLKNYYCWAVGDKKNPYTGGGSLNGKAFNRNTISIEVCSNLKKGTSASAANHEGWYYTDETLDNAVKLSKILMKKYDIPLENVVRHYDITGKVCPGVIGWNNSTIYSTDGKKTNEKSDSKKWEEFKKRLED